MLKVCKRTNCTKTFHNSKKGQVRKSENPYKKGKVKIHTIQKGQVAWKRNLAGYLQLEIIKRYKSTPNSLTFIERDTALNKEEIYRKIDVLRNACDTGDDLIAKEAIRSVVPTFKTPEEQYDFY